LTIDLNLVTIKSFIENNAILREGIKMKISELMKKLEDVKANAGDIEVVADLLMENESRVGHIEPSEFSLSVLQTTIDSIGIKTEHIWPTGEDVSGENVLAFSVDPL
jgi:hypothetical protein